jgi:hypothetical protein
MATIEFRYRWHDKETGERGVEVWNYEAAKPASWYAKHPWVRAYA